MGVIGLDLGCPIPSIPLKPECDKEEWVMVGRVEGVLTSLT